ncbi:MAG: fatty acid desaturase [Polyangiaceae bacterium]|jgi:alkane 1-monooxygenase
MENVPEVDTAPVTATRAVVAFAPHVLALLFPLNALAFVLTGPHRGWVSALFLVPVFGSVWLDSKSVPETRQPAAKMPGWPFDALLLVLVGLQFANVALAARMMHAVGILRADTLVAMVVVGSSSAYSGIVVAHELVHRPGKAWQTLGRLILCTVIYEHFYTEHIRGHHVRVGTDSDPATARFGESFRHFYRRTVPAQFRSAWRLETRRLGDADMTWYDLRLLRSRVLHGVVVEFSIAVAIAVFFGPAAIVAHLLQAWWASRALEVVNYFEHWGLRREGKRVLPMHSWDTHSSFTYYALTGLSRHADHHAFALRPYQQLRVWEESPKLPGGYLAMFPLVLGRNARFQRLMTEELRRKKLGPFVEGSTPSTVAA